MRLEPCAVKVASTVLRGRSASNGTLLPDKSDAARIICVIGCKTEEGLPFMPYQNRTACAPQNVICDTGITRLFPVCHIPHLLVS
jgi:hypothetical protein